MLYLDSAGALISAIMLGVVLVYFKKYIGMPTGILYTLAGIALIFCLYSGISATVVKGDQRPFLLVIAIANFLYCGLTGILVLVFHRPLTHFGILYFVLEIIIVLMLVRWEWKIANRE